MATTDSAALAVISPSLRYKRKKLGWDADLVERVPAGIPKWQKPNQRLCIKDIRRQRSEGLSFVQIAEKLGISKQRLNHWTKKWGIR